MRYKATKFLLWFIQKINKSKDRSLAMELHDLADQYDPRPTGEWQHVDGNGLPDGQRYI